MQAPSVSRAWALIAVRIKETGQLTGVIESFNSIAEKYVQTYDSSTGTWSDYVLDRHPAWAFAHVLRGPENEEPLSDAKLNPDDLADWAAATPGYCYDQVVDYATTRALMLAEICSVAMARPVMRDLKVTVFHDRLQEDPVALITPRNSWGYKGKKIFVDLPHAIRSKWVSPDRNYETETTMIYRDGYDESNATKVENMEFPGIKSYGQLYPVCRYHLGVGEHRPERHEVYQDFENLRCRNR